MKTKNETSPNKESSKTHHSASNQESDVVELDGRKDENKENEDEDSDDIQEIPIS